MKTEISFKTYKNLLSTSANRCAHPQCEAMLVEPSREGSPVRISGRACRIYVVDEEGPRGKPGISQEEMDSQQNLVLLCPEHCAAAVARHESFTSAELAFWKREREEEGRGVNFSSPRESAPIHFSRPLSQEKSGLRWMSFGNSGFSRKLKAQNIHCVFLTGSRAEICFRVPI